MSSWDAQGWFYLPFEIHGPQNFVLKHRRSHKLLPLSVEITGECPQLVLIRAAFTRPTCISLIPQLLSMRSWQAGRWTVHACGLSIVGEVTPPPPVRAPCCESDVVCAPGISRFLPPSPYVRDKQCWVASKCTHTFRRAQCSQTDTPPQIVTYPGRNFLTR
jgi:hypothetical protein